MNSKLAFAIQILLVFGACSCRNAARSDNASEELIGLSPVDTLELFFQSKGILRFDATELNLKKDFEILNEDSTVYATLNLSLDKMIILGRTYPLSEFAKDKPLRNEYQFFPKEFFPDNSIIQFEYASVSNEMAEIFIDKDHGIKKRIRLIGDMFKSESWKEHMVGCMIDFDAVVNPIRSELLDTSRSLGYEGSGEDYIFLINEIVGDWVRIECADVCDYPCSSGEKYDGWIRWKDDNKLLIRLLYSC